MGDPCPIKCPQAFVPIRISFLVAVVMCGALGSGCFVLRGERRIKPDAGGAIIKVDMDYSGPMYCRVVDSPDFKLQVGVANGPARWELQFLLNILPIYVYRINQTTWPLSANVDLEPRSPGITFNPWQTYFQGTNHARVPPNMIWQDDGVTVTNDTGAILVTNRTMFHLKFLGPQPGYLDQDSPFQVSIEGIRVSGQNSILPPIQFEPRTVVRPGYRLPY